jgi:deoxyribonuclease-4
MDRTQGETRATPGRPLIGAQVSAAGGFTAVPTRAAAMGAEVVQVFSSNPRTWLMTPPDPGGLSVFAADLREQELPLFLHTIYLINLASPDSALRARSTHALAHALVAGALSNAAGVVTHIGSHRGEGAKNAVGRVVDSACAAMVAAQEWAITLTADPATSALPPLLLETAAGSGATMGGDLEELATILERLPPSTGLCLDTAHLFAAGYAVHRARGLDALVAELRRLDLLRRVGLVHLNDSGSAFASKHDRHENPGDGQIGLQALGRIVRYPAFAPVPFVLEVPGPDKRGPSASEIAIVKGMRDAAHSGSPVRRGRKPEKTS